MLVHLQQVGPSNYRVTATEHSQAGLFVSSNMQEYPDHILKLNTLADGSDDPSVTTQSNEDLNNGEEEPA